MAALFVVMLYRLHIQLVSDASYLRRGANCSRTPRPFHFAFLHFMQSRRPSSRCTGVSAGRLIAARSTLLWSLAARALHLKP